MTSSTWRQRALAFTTFFGFAPDFTHGQATNINGDDAIELFLGTDVVDVFGTVGMSGTGQPWEYTDGWAYRVDETGQDGSTFVLANWSFSGINALDGEATNATAMTPFQLGTYTEDSAPPPPNDSVIINEVDADTPGTDMAEFVEIYDGGAGSTPLDGLALVFYNGSNDLTYGSLDLDNVSTDPDGYAVICGDVDAVFFANCDVDSAQIQNGPDAVALYQGNAADFPNGTAISTDGLVDALVYDTADADDPGLLTLLNPGQPQVDENGAGAGDTHSNQRCPNGSGGARNTNTYAQFIPTVGVANVCEVVPPDPVARLIHEIQSDGPASPFDATGVVVEAVVVGDFQGTGALRGFYLQEEDAQADTNPLTSEGIFVFDASFGVDVAIGDLVEVTGTVDEFNGSTQIGTVTSVNVISAGNSVTPATVTLPVTAITDLEAFEGMSVQLPQNLTISEFFNYDRFGEIVLSTERQFQPTALFEPGSAEATQLALNQCPEPDHPRRRADSAEPGPGDSPERGRVQPGQLVPGRRHGHRRRRCARLRLRPLPDPSDTGGRLRRREPSSGRTRRSGRQSRGGVVQRVELLLHDRHRCLHLRPTREPGVPWSGRRR